MVPHRRLVAVLAGDVQWRAAVVVREVEFNPQDLANTAWAYATAGHSAPALFDALASASVRSAPWKLTAPIGSRDDLDGKLSVRRVLTREPSRPRGSGQNRAITAKIAFETPEKRVERSAPASKPD